MVSVERAAGADAEESGCSGRLCEAISCAWQLSPVPESPCGDTILLEAPDTTLAGNDNLLEMNIKL